MLGCELYCTIELIKEKQSDTRRVAYDTASDGVGNNSSGTFTGVTKHNNAITDKRAQEKKALSKYQTSHILYE